MRLPKGLSIVDVSVLRVAKLYNTNIVIINNDSDMVTLNSGNWRTKHTKKCINLVIERHGLKVIQKDFEWYVIGRDGKKTPFFDSMQIDLSA